MAAALTLAVQVRLPAVPDVDDRESVVERAERDVAPTRALKEFGGALREFVDRQILGFVRAAIGEPRLEGVEEGRRAGETGFSQCIRTAAAWPNGALEVLAVDRADSALVALADASNGS